jgi:predicted metal-dependent phosphotriesterase family hydrolase
MSRSQQHRPARPDLGVTEAQITQMLVDNPRRFLESAVA